MKITIGWPLIAAALWACTAHAAPPVQKPQQQQKPQETEVQKDIDSIVANCEKKKLPTEEEIKCIERGFLEFMGESEPDGS